MSAVVGVLNESLTESIKGFYKLRKAYLTLSGILDAENRYQRTKIETTHTSRCSIDSLRSNRSANSTKGVPGGFRDGHEQIPPASAINSSASQGHDHVQSVQVEDSSDEEADFHDAKESVDDVPRSTSYDGQVKIGGLRQNLEDLSVDHDYFRSTEPPANSQPLPMSEEALDHEPGTDIFANPIDVFIHSSANMCFGLLLVLISLIPPAFGKLFYIIGFRGDRNRGLGMLWQASKFHNINGAMAGLVLLGFYNAIVGYADILPDQEKSSQEKQNIEGYPKERCEALLTDMRTRHPRSYLWLLEDARMRALNRQLSSAVALLSNGPPSALKQVEALAMFEKSLDAMCMHDYNLCAASFIACVSLNNWSHALYYYIAGAAHVELYRHYKNTSPRAAAIHAKKATDLLKSAPKNAGKKKFMARQLPLDLFVNRKVNKWENRSREWNIEFIDAVGVSPIEEMISLWNGYKRMDQSQLETSLTALAWSEDIASNPNWHREGHDERGILALLKSTTLRNLQQWDAATKVLKEGVLDVDKAEFKGGFKDDWPPPVAHYEMGVICWMRRQESNESSNRAEHEESEEEWVRECEQWIDKAARWESYVLDTRIGVRIATAQGTLKRWREQRNAS